MSMLTSWQAFTDSYGLPDLYGRFILDLWDHPVTVTAKAWLATDANKIVLAAQWNF